MLARLFGLIFVVALGWLLGRLLGAARRRPAARSRRRCLGPLSPGCSGKLPELSLNERQQLVPGMGVWWMIQLKLGI